MNWDLLFFTNSIALGVGLAMDAFSVSLANGLNEPSMKKTRMILIAGIFALFQCVMPLTGWICVHTVVQYFNSVSAAIPWIALALLGYIGGKMLYEGVHPEKEDDNNNDHALTIINGDGGAIADDVVLGTGIGATATARKAFLSL